MPWVSQRVNESTSFFGNMSMGRRLFFGGGGLLVVGEGGF